MADREFDEVFGEILNHDTSKTFSDLNEHDICAQLDKLCNEEENMTKRLLTTEKLIISKCPIMVLTPQISQLTHLTQLSILNTCINILPDEIGYLSNLIILELDNNWLTELPDSIQHLTKLKRLSAQKNFIKCIHPSLGHLIKLLYLFLNDNMLRILPVELSQLTQLIEFDCSDNSLEQFPHEFESMIKLKYLDLTGNNLTALPDTIGQLNQLESFIISNNQLTVLPKSMGQLTHLTFLDFGMNRLTTLPIELINLRQSQIFLFGNPFEYIPPNLNRFLFRDTRNGYQNVYSDRQNVHNHGIQDSIANSINYLIQQKPSLTLSDMNTSIINNQMISKQTKQLLFEYMANPEVHSRYQLTFTEILIAIMDKIRTYSEDIQNEIYQILNIEMADSECKCVTGRISRVVNCLNGIDPNIQIQISDSEQIGNIIGLIQRQLETNGTYSVQSHQDRVRRELLERGYDDKVITDWITAIA
jgi:Leucine-rich repeat (LRR) protein